MASPYRNLTENMSEKQCAYLLSSYNIKPVVYKSIMYAYGADNQFES